MNDKAVCRTAPVTPGLLIISLVVNLWMTPVQNNRKEKQCSTVQCTAVNYSTIQQCSTVQYSSALQYNTAVQCIIVPSDLGQTAARETVGGLWLSWRRVAGVSNGVMEEWTLEY